MIAILLGLTLLLPLIESLSLGNRLVNLLRPSSTRHLAELLDLYDTVQDPSFLTSEEWRSSFSSIISDVEVTSQGTVEGLGLIAKRDFSAGQVVAFYPIHAIGFSNGKSPPRFHAPTERMYSSTTTSNTTVGGDESRIIGTSDLVYFEDESHVFGDTQEDFSYAMTDPSGKYVFDVNLERSSKRRRVSTESSPNENLTIASAGNDADLFVAHYVNDASFADFSSVVNAAKALRQRQYQQQSIGIDNDADDGIREGMELNAEAAGLAVNYLETSTGTTATSAIEQTGFNVVMCGFGPPPLMAYVTTRPVRKGEELLASYGLGYWLGKSFPDEDDTVLDAALAALDAMPVVRQAQDRADDAVEAALDAGDLAVRTKYGALTQLIRDTFAKLRKDRRRRQKRR